MKKFDQTLVWGALYLVLGVLFLVLKGETITIAMTITGIAAILLGASDLLQQNTTAGAVKVAAGVCLLVFGWALVSLALYLFAALLVVYGVSLLLQPQGGSRGLLEYLEAGAILLAGVVLFFNQSGSVAWIFTLAGILLIAEGVLTLLRRAR